jgi:D-arabinose 1-dehydrogenase-like Zn-dependent alcohol dehydrogenase
VYGLALGCLATHICADARLHVLRPQTLVHEEVATLPTLWSTIDLAFGSEGARIAAAQSVLIHAGTGGIGLMALDYAHLCSATVAASVGRPGKTALVQQLGIATIVSSRSSSAFLTGASRLIRGTRLRSVLSALTKEFIPASLALLSSGLYLEVGKNSIWSAERMAAASCFEPFHLVALDFKPPAWITCELETLRSRVEAGKVRPLPLQTVWFQTADMIGERDESKCFVNVHVSVL